MNSWYLAARVVIATGAVGLVLWGPASMWIAFAADDGKGWFEAFLGGSVLIALFVLPVAGALAAIGWAFG